MWKVTARKPVYCLQKWEATEENIEEDAESLSKIKSARSASASATESLFIGYSVGCGYVKSAGLR